MATAMGAQVDCVLKPVTLLRQPTPVPAHATEYGVFLPARIAAAPDGSIYFSELTAHRILAVSPEGTLRVIAANLRYPGPLAVAPDGTLYFLEEGKRLFRQSPQGARTRIFADIKFHTLLQVVVNGRGDMFALDAGAGQVYRYDSRGVSSAFPLAASPVARIATLPRNRLLIKYTPNAFAILGEDGVVSRPAELQSVAFYDLYQGANDVPVLLNGPSLFTYIEGQPPLALGSLPSYAIDRTSLARLPSGPFLAIDGSGAIGSFVPSNAPVASAPVIIVPRAVQPPLTEDVDASRFFATRTILLPHPRGQLYFVRDARIYRLNSGRIERVPVADELEVRGAAFDAEGNLYILSQRDQAVYRVFPDGRLAPPLEGKPWTPPVGQDYFEENGLIAANGHLYSLWRTRVFTYSLSTGATANYETFANRFDKTYDDRVFAYQLNRYACLAPTESACRDNRPILPQDSATRATPIGESVYFAGMQLYRRDAQDRWHRLLLDWSIAPAAPNFTRMQRLADNSFALVDTGNSAIWSLSNPQSCSTAALPYFPSGGRLVSAAAYSDADTLSPNSLITIFGESMNASIPPESFDRSFTGILSAQFYPVFGLSDTSGIVQAMQPFSVFPGQASFAATSLDQNSAIEPQLFVVSGTIRYPYPAKLRAARVAPGLFVQGSLKDGSAAALNQDSSLNTASNPAPQGSVVVLFGSGFGDFRTGPPLSVRVGGLPTEILFSGQAPGLITGLWQINVRLPQSLTSGRQPIEIEAAGQLLSQRQAVTVHVR